MVGVKGVGSGRVWGQGGRVGGGEGQGVWVAVVKGVRSGGGQGGRGGGVKIGVVGSMG